MMYDNTGSQIEDISCSLLTSEILDEIIMDGYPHLRLGPSVSQVIMLLVNGFMEDTLKSSYLISRMRGHFEIYSEDILIHLKRKYPSTCLCEFCDFQQKDLLNSDTLDSNEIDCQINTGIKSLKSFDIGRLHKMFDLHKKMSEHLI